MGLSVRPEELAHLYLFFKKAGEADKRSLAFRDPGIDSGYISISEERSNNSQPQGKWWYHIYGTGRQKRPRHWVEFQWKRCTLSTPAGHSSCGPNTPSTPSILIL